MNGVERCYCLHLVIRSKWKRSNFLYLVFICNMKKEIKQILNELNSLALRHNDLLEYDHVNNSWTQKALDHEEYLLSRYLPQVIELAEYYAKANVDDREAIREKVKEESYLLLRAFFLRLARNANRFGEKHLLFLALIVLSIEDFREDYRLGILNLRTMSEETEKMGVDRKELFEKVALLSSASFARWLRSKNPRAW